MTILTILGVTQILCSFRLVLEGKTGKEIPESSRLEFLEKFSVNNFALSDEEDNTSRPINRGGIADLPLLRTLLAIHQSSICKFGSFKNPFAIIAGLSELYFRFREFYSVSTNKKSELWQLHKHLKTMEMSEASPDTYDEGYIHQFQPEPT